MWDLRHENKGETKFLLKEWKEDSLLVHKSEDDDTSHQNNFDDDGNNDTDYAICCACRQQCTLFNFLFPCQRMLHAVNVTKNKRVNRDGKQLCNNVLMVKVFASR